MVIYGVKTNIKNEYDYLPKDTANTPEIRNYWKNEKVPFEKLYHSYINKNIENQYNKLILIFLLLLFIRNTNFMGFLHNKIYF